MRTRLLVTLMCLSLVGIGAHVARASVAAPVNACKVLTAAVRDKPFAWAVRLTKENFLAAAGDGWRCEITSVPPKGSVSPTFVVVLTFFASPSAAVAHTNLAYMPKKGPRLTGTGRTRRSQ